MKKFLGFVGAIFISTFAIAQTISIDWVADENIYAQTTCDVGDNLVLPSTPPTKYGHTFVGWVKPEYAELEYIAFAVGRSIDTGFVPNAGITIEAKIKHGSTKAFIGSCDSGIELNYDQYTFRKTGQTRSKTDYTDIVILYLQTTGTNFIGKIDDTYVVNESDVTFNKSVNSPNMRIGIACGNSPRGGQYYYVKIWDGDGVLVRDMIPAQRLSDDAVGMYDKANNQFYTISGSGDYEAGPIVGAF